MPKAVKVGDVKIGGKSRLALIAGPCVIESRKKCLSLAGKLVRMAKDEAVPYVFKASYDKANRTSVKSYRGPGIEKGLDVLKEVKEKYGVPILTDVHSEYEVDAVAEVADILQVPAFLSRQTDIVVAAGRTGKVVNVKKGQFLAPHDMKNVVGKIESTGNRKILLTERGSSFGYNNLIVDMSGIEVMRELGYPVVFDATHSVQRPGGAGNMSGGDSRLAPGLARAAVAVGCDAVFFETYVNPAEALCDGANALPVTVLRKLMRTLRSIDEIVG